MTKEELVTMAATIRRRYPKANVMLDRNDFDSWLKILEEVEFLDASVVLNDWMAKYDYKAPSAKYIRDKSRFVKLEREKIEEFRRHTDTLDNYPEGNDSLSRLIRRITDDELKRQGSKV